MLFFYSIFLILQLCVNVLLANTVIVVTGSSTGIGKAIVEEFAKLGNDYKIYATMRNIDKAEESLKLLSNIEILPLDVTKSHSVDDTINKIISKEGKIDVLVNNAGYGIAGTVEACTMDEVQDIFDVNVFGIIRVLQAVLPSMRTNQAGHIINISSTSGIRGIAGMDYYTSSKFALEGLTDSLRYSLAPFNIAISNINAGPVRTAFINRFGKSQVGGMGTRDIDDNTGYLKYVADKAVSNLENRMNSPEAQTPENVASVVVNVYRLYLEAKRMEDVPFNVGTSTQSMAILEHVRKFPTGWGGMFTALLQRMPTLQDAMQAMNNNKNKEHEEL